MFCKGEDVAQSSLVAERFYKISIEDGNIKAICNYAFMLKNGEGIPMNIEETAKYFEMAADKEHVDVMRNYADILQKGYK